MRYEKIWTKTSEPWTKHLGSDKNFIKMRDFRSLAAYSIESEHNLPEHVPGIGMGNKELKS